MSSKYMEVSEIFGPTLQGEGPSVGSPAIFLRLRRCNLACEWCDTKYTWQASDPGYETYRRMTALQVADEVQKIRGRSHVLVITGGEPLIWQVRIAELVDELEPVWSELRIEIETAGTIQPSTPGLKWASFVSYNVSPKLASSGNEERKRIRFGALEYFASLGERANFKFVVSEKEDLQEIIELQAALEIDSRRIWLMPQAATPEELRLQAPIVAEYSKNYGYNFSSRLQVELWGGQRGT